MCYQTLKSFHLNLVFEGQHLRKSFAMKFFRSRKNIEYWVNAHLQNKGQTNAFWYILGNTLEDLNTFKHTLTPLVIKCDQK